MLSKTNENIPSLHNLKNLDSIFNYIYRTDESQITEQDSVFGAKIKETNNLFIIYATLKGCSKKDISISYENKFLIIEIHSKYTLLSNRRMFFVDDIQLNNIFTSFQKNILKIVILKDNKKISAV